MRKVTLKDIANKLGVTIGTVSHVLNGIDDISEETKNKVLKAAREMGYISNSAAVSLRSGKTHTVAVIVPDISNPYIAHQVKSIEMEMRKFNYSVFILNTNEDEETEYEAIVSACSKQVDGIFLCPCQKSTKNVEFLDKLQIPYILICRYFNSYETDYIGVDDYKGGRLAGEYLINKGYKNIIYFGAYKYICSSVDRFRGIKDIFKENEIDIPDSRFIEINPTCGDNGDIIEETLRKTKDFDSIIAFSDFVAFEIRGKLKELCSGVKLPVVSFDAVNTYFKFPFENISVGVVDNELSSQAVKAMLEKIDSGKCDCKKLIDVKLYEFNC
ncbi:MAG: LacI family DNA-binding transcriptional regulator [Clostridia bacterium]|nr:LacI family DNA-binding transcriptional regulator [Clostridia bacterium]